MILFLFFILILIKYLLNDYSYNGNYCRRYSVNSYFNLYYIMLSNKNKKNKYHIFYLFILIIYLSKIIIITINDIKELKK